MQLICSWTGSHGGKKRRWFGGGGGGGGGGVGGGFFQPFPCSSESAQLPVRLPYQADGARNIRFLRCPSPFLIDDEVQISRPMPFICRLL